MINPTYIDYVMLGIIQQKPVSGYGILKALKELSPGNFSSSPGTIYPALKRLQRFGLVKESASAKASKKLFELSSRGQVFLIAWLLDPISVDDVRRRKEELLLRFTFMDELVSQNEKKHFLTSFQQQSKNYLQKVQARLKADAELLSQHQKMTLEHEISSYKSTIKWSQRVLRDI